MSKLTNTCPHCGTEGELVADYYEAVNQSIEVDEEGNYDYTGTTDSYDDGSTGDECIRCGHCNEVVEEYGAYQFEQAYEGRKTSDGHALDLLNILLSAPEWPGASGMEDVLELVRATGRIEVPNAPEWERH